MQKDSENMFMYMAQAAWRHAGTARPRMALIYVTFFFANIILGFQPAVLAKIINSVQVGGDAALWSAVMWAAVYSLLIVGFWIFHGPSRVIERRLGFIIFNSYTAQLYKMVTELPLRWHQDHHSGDTINRINKAGRALFNFAQEQFTIIQMTVRFGMSMIMLGFYSLSAMAASLVSSLIIATIIRRFDKKLIPIIQVTNEREHRLNATLFDYISNIVTVLTLRLQENTRGEVDYRIKEMKPSFWREVKLTEIKWGLINTLLVAAQAGIVGGYIAFHMWAHETLAIGSIVAIFQYLLMINQVFYDAAQIYGRLMQRHTDVHGVDGLIHDHARLQGAGLLAAPKPDWSKIEIKHLNFTHREGEDVLHHLRDVNLTIKSGQKIALIGFSGSGKTTLLTLLRGLYEPAHVNLVIDGVPLQNLSPLGGFTTLVPQDSEIFENTVRYNLTLDTEVSEEALQEAMKITTFDEVVPKLPEGIATDIRERGVNLSGGQKQRLALARGLIAAQNSSLLLLDEPTSSVDLQTEGILFDRLFAAFKDKAIVASIHRLHLLPRFDMIGVMRDGMMVEQGSFIELLAQHGIFYSLWQNHLAQSAAQDNSSPLRGGSENLDLALAKSLVFTGEGVICFDITPSPAKTKDLLKQVQVFASSPSRGEEKGT